MGGYQGQNLALLFFSSNYAVLLSYFAIWTPRYGLHVRYYVFQIRHFMITNCNGPFQFSLLFLYFVFLLRYLITNCFFCSVSYPLLPLCNSVVQLRCSFMLLRCFYAVTLFRCTVTLFRCTVLRCSFMLLLRCSDVLFPARF